VTLAASRESNDVAVPAVLLAVVAWGLGPLMVRGMSVDGTTVALYRMWLGTPVMFVAARVWGQPMTLAVLKKCVVPGVFFGLSMMFGFQAARTTSIAAATLISHLTPALMVLGLGRLLGERTELRRLPFAFVSLFGLVLVVLVGSNSDGASLKGDFYALVNVACWTVYFIILKRTRDAGIDGWTFLSGVFLVGSIVITPWCLVASDDLTSVNAKDYLLLAGMILGPGLVGHGLVTWASRHLDATVTSLLTLLGPVVSVVGAWLIYDQSLGWNKVIGAAMVLGGLAGTVWGRSRADALEAP
jgi:drug/metabolite transporter (DMT)-like permease